MSAGAAQRGRQQQPRRRGSGAVAPQRRGLCGRQSAGPGISVRPSAAHPAGGGLDITSSAPSAGVGRYFPASAPSAGDGRDFPGSAPSAGDGRNFPGSASSAGGVGNFPDSGRRHSVASGGSAGHVSVARSRTSSIGRQDAGSAYSPSAAPGQLTASPGRQDADTAARSSAGNIADQASRDSGHLRLGAGSSAAGLTAPRQLERFNLDRPRREDSKKEDEKKRRYRLIPRSFSNWLQAFAIMASVIGEKAPENCSALFCYLDAIGKAYTTYGGQGWLRYDEQFRQRKAFRPSIRWDHKDIALWMRVMVPSRLACYYLLLEALRSKGVHRRAVSSARIKKEFRDDLKMWADFLDEYNGRSLWIQPVADATSLGILLHVVEMSGFGLFFHVAAFPGFGTTGGERGSGLSSGIVEPAARAVTELFTKSLADSSWSHYNQAWSLWESWMSSMDQDMEEEYGNVWRQRAYLQHNIVVTPSGSGQRLRPLGGVLGLIRCSSGSWGIRLLCGLRCVLRFVRTVVNWVFLKRQLSAEMERKMYNLSKQLDVEEVTNMLLDDRDLTLNEDLGEESEIDSHDEVEECVLDSETEQDGDSGEDEEVGSYYIGKDKNTKWNKKPFQKKRREPLNIITHLPAVIGTARNAKTAVECWNSIFTDDILDSIVTYTNQYIDIIKDKYICNRTIKRTDEIELRAFFGLLYLAGAYRANRQSLEELWGKDGDGVEKFSLVMSINRFKILIRCLRFDDRTTRTERKTHD
ncbi:unnamed protein product [Ranitomeya imitator]|uniref:PiggyBac transposable element-derived protein domain-containing protein n=1 Tax=Ranitomeya imitator TaxID=111125 RepID=A0ABN9MBV0_9NEOB|nr:unnamed protein product [Ranitomeya imitator]